MLLGKALVFVIASIISYSSEGFQWSGLQLSSHVINSYIGRNVILPCQFILTAQEHQQSQEFNAIIWSRERPTGSQKWQALTAKTHISGFNESSLPEILASNKDKFQLKNNSLTIVNVDIEDDTQYQCEMKSSFYTSPSVIKVNVVYKPYNTRIKLTENYVKQKTKTSINCTAKANPKAGFAFYHNSQLVQNSTSQYLIINSTLNRHKGQYMCIPWNLYGNGPNATTFLDVQDVKITDEPKMLSDEIIAGITGAVVLVLVLVMVTAIMCQRLRTGKQESQSNNKSTRDLSESHLGPAVFGSDASISSSATKATKTSNRDMKGSHGVPSYYGSDIDMGDPNGLRYGSAIPKENKIFYGNEVDYSMANGKYTPKEHKLLKLSRSSSNGIKPIDSES